MDTDIYLHTGICLRSNLCENHSSSINRIFICQLEGHRTIAQVLVQMHLYSIFYKKTLKQIKTKHIKKNPKSGSRNI